MSVPQPARFPHHVPGPAPPSPLSQVSSAKPFTFNSEDKAFEPQPEGEKKKKKRKKTGYRTQRPSKSLVANRCANIGCPTFWNHPTHLCAKRIGLAVWNDWGNRGQQ
ncbi:hypothetical protein EK21DRAFT_86044 [Setomelanomma holmii]|uniref:Uncharacterized protein n=1 Tax=Setomelanomma holmii TaxID=210430 RepID=A0A9P4HFE1_9PLEO|nr:hypothetical protein EK21DRAFT_86044 [Setomelanomma holmii]